MLVLVALLLYAAPPTHESVPAAEASFGGYGFFRRMKDHMRKFVLNSVLALALVSSTSAAFAQQQAQQAQRSGTPEEQAACNRDVQRHCRSVINQGDFVILACLQQNRAHISAACNQVLKNHGQ